MRVDELRLFLHLHLRRAPREAEDFANGGRGFVLPTGGFPLQDSVFLVAANRSSNSRNRKAHRRLLLGADSAVEDVVTIPTRWLKNIIGLFLVPVAWVLTQALFTSFPRTIGGEEFWATAQFWFFTLGAMIWMLAFFGSLWASGEPWFLRAYVFAHELTHAFWAKVCGGEVYQFKAARAGGHIVTDTHNFWIALTPYFHPLYSIVVIELYAVVRFFYNIEVLTPVLFGLLGLTWAFHFSFTLWMIPKGQSDLSTNGTFFSLVVIYLMNLAVLAALIIFAAPEVTFIGFWDEIVRHGGELSAAVVNLVNVAIHALVTRGDGLMH
jgi:hypothetical protein